MSAGTRREVVLRGFDFIELSFALIFLLLGLAGLRVVVDPGLWDEFAGEGANGSVGTVARDDGSVRWRGGGTMAWHDVVGAPHGVSGGDAVFTGADGRATLDLRRQTTLEVQPGSLVIIPRTPTGAGWQEWVARLANRFPVLARGQATLIVKSGRVWLKPGPGVEAIRVQGNHGPMELKPGEELGADGKRAAHVAPVPKPAPVAVAIAPPPKPVSPPATVAPVKTVPAKPAVRIAPRSKPAPPKSVANTGAIEILPTLELASSGGSTRLGAGGDLDKLTVLLQWKALKGIDRYDVTVYKTDGTKVVTTDTHDSQFPLVLTSLENYNYEVSVTLPTGKKISSNRIPIRLEISHPVPKVPENGAMIDVGDRALFTWEKTSVTENYEIQISRARDFSTMEESNTTPDNFFVYGADAEGTFFWRVRSTGKAWQSKWCDTRSFIVK